MNIDWKNKKVLIPAAIVAGALLIFCIVFFINKIIDHRVPNFQNTRELYVYPGNTVADIMPFLVDSCEAKRPRSVARAFKKTEKIEVGHYTIDTSMPSVYVERMLSHGWQTPIKLVIGGTLRTRGGIAKKISSQMLFDSTAMVSAMADSSLLSKFGFKPANVFALFVPDTYQVYWTESPEEILERQKKAYDDFWTEDNKKKAADQGLSQMEASILASIVKGETNYEPEMPSIAGVYLNRLHKGMKLQADPTIAYLLDYEVNRILYKHLEIESPFNTYKHAGLPPAPIYVPTKACLNAVLNPDRHGYMFFCASPEFNGTHRFAVSYSEHLKNAREFSRALDARNAAKKAEEKAKSGK